MTIPVRGHGLTLGIGAETVWGTPVARTNWLRLASSSLARRRIREPSPSLGYYGRPSTNLENHFVAAEESGGGIEWIAGYSDSTLMLLAHVFGEAPTDAGSGPYTHTYALASPPLVGFTGEEIKGTHGTLPTAQVFEGCKINTFTMTSETGRPVMCSADIIAETAGGIVTPGSPTYSSNNHPILHNHFNAANSLTWNGEVLAVRRLVLTVERNLSRNPQLGSLTTGEPFESRLRIGLEFEVLWQSNMPWTGHYADTSSDATWTFANSTRSAAWTAHNCVIDDVSAPVSDAGAISQTVRMTAYADATDTGLGLVVTNGNALYTAN